MHEALHPTLPNRITAQQYFTEYGRPPASRTAVDNRPNARCPFCPQELNTIAPAKGGHFAHFGGSHWCPSKEKTARPYLDLQPTEPDEASAIRLKQEFRDTWRLHYKELASLAPELAYGEFVELLRRANRLNLWAYRGLLNEHLPYVLPLLADFSPATGIQRKTTSGSSVPGRRLWLRFIYSSDVRCPEDLWIRPTGPAQLFRVSYRPRPRGAPGTSDIMKSVEIHRSPAFLSAAAPTLHPFVVSNVEKWLTEHLS
ncbi:hypothetical protein P3T16_006444 [Paraburkholderia sp. GAS42]